MSRLLSPDLEIAPYHAALLVNQQFFSVLEKTRKDLDVCPQLSLARSLDALWSDLGAPVETPMLALPDINGTGMLGALYVAHGSTFGRSVIGKAIARTLPCAPQHYFSLPTDTHTWRHLLDALENVARTDATVSALEQGAQDAFALFSDLADLSSHVATGPRPAA